MKTKGIDVSYHNGKIKWETVKPYIDFAMIRCGYGKNNIDREFKNNANACEDLKIPFGVYWFSYAYTEEMAKAEANYCCDACEKYKLHYPVAFDFEYGSETYAEKHGAKMTNELRVNLARAFLNQVRERGYYPILYTNEDYIRNKGHEVLLGEYDIWYARYNSNPEPARECDMWQYGGEKIGCLKLVDVDWCYKDYPHLIDPYYNVHNLTEDMILRIIKDSDLYWLNCDYIELAYEVIEGKFGVGIERKEKIEALGFNYDIAQSVVNTILHYKED